MKAYMHQCKRLKHIFKIFKDKVQTVASTLWTKMTWTTKKLHRHFKE